MDFEISLSVQYDSMTVVGLPVTNRGNACVFSAAMFLTYIPIFPRKILTVTMNLEPLPLAHTTGHPWLEPNCLNTHMLQNINDVYRDIYVAEYGPLRRKTIFIPKITQVHEDKTFLL